MAHQSTGEVIKPVKLKWLLSLAIALIFAGQIHAQNSVTANLTAQAANDAACAAASCVTLNINSSSGGVTVDLDGTFSGTLTFEASANGGVKFRTLSVTPTNSSTTVTTATAVGSWQANIAGYTQLRIRFSTYSSGTAVATINASLASARSGGGGGGTGVTEVDTTGPLTGGPITTTGTLSITANGIGAAQLAAQYSKGSCTELWGGSGTSFALTSGDDAVSNNSCYNDSGVTRTITAVKARSDNGTNTTTVNPTFGAAGTGTTICSGALTAGSSLAYSSSCTVSNASWTTGTGITPAMGGTLTGTSIAMIVEYTF